MPDEDQGQSFAEHPARSILGMLAVIVVPAVIALSTVVSEREKVPLEPQPSPYGYTWSLLFFIVPVLALGVWFHRRPQFRGSRRAYWVAFGALFSLGVILDVLFGALFFRFPNAGATIGVRVPVVGGWVPIEEFGFYSAGFGAILLMYVWCDSFWLGRYHQRVLPRERIERRRHLISIHPYSVIAAVIIFAAAYAWKKQGPHIYNDGFPGYFLFLLLVGIMPNIIFFRCVERCINWRAVCFTGMVLLPVSLLWEGVLAVPYGWWDYNDEQMIGITVHALSGLPVEAVLLWLVVAYAGITIYEVVNLWVGVSKGQFRKYVAQR